MSFVVKDARSGRVLVRDSCVFDPDLNKFSKDVLNAMMMMQKMKLKMMIS